MVCSWHTPGRCFAGKGPGRGRASGHHWGCRGARASFPKPAHPSDHPRQSLPKMLSPLASSIPLTPPHVTPFHRTTSSTAPPQSKSPSRAYPKLLSYVRVKQQETYKSGISAAAMRLNRYLAQQVVVRIAVQGALRPSGPEPHRALVHAAGSFLEGRADRHSISQLRQDLCMACCM